MIPAFWALLAAVVVGGEAPDEIALSVPELVGGVAAWSWEEGGRWGVPDQSRVQGVWGELFGGQVRVGAGMMQLTRRPSLTVALHVLESGGIPLTRLPDSTAPVGPGNAPVVVGDARFLQAWLRLGGWMHLREEAAWRLGLWVHFVGGDLAGVSGWGVGADAGVLGRYARGTWMVMLRRWTTTWVRWGGGTWEVYPPSLTFSGTLDLHPWRLAWGASVQGAGEASSSAFALGRYGVDVSAMAGYRWPGRYPVILMAGWDRWNPAVGLQVIRDAWRIGVGYQLHLDLGPSYRLEWQWQPSAPGSVN